MILLIWMHGKIKKDKLKNDCIRSKVKNDKLKIDDIRRNVGVTIIENNMFEINFRWFGLVQ